MMSTKKGINMKDEKTIMEFSELLKKAKNKLGMNHVDFASWLGVAKDSYINWYNAKQGVRPDSKRIEIIEKINRELNIE